MILLSLGLLFSSASFAQGIDFLGDLASPLLGDAKGKAQGIMKYFWLQPYGGYAFGGGDLDVKGSTTFADYSTTYDSDGLFYGARGGIELGDTFRVGLDFTIQSTSTNEPVRNATTGVWTKTDQDYQTTTLALCAGFDIPSTPLQLFAAKYIDVSVKTDPASTGDGWAVGTSFVIVNPFILIAEYRNLEVESSTGNSGEIYSRSNSQYYLALSFLLL